MLMRITERNIYLHGYLADPDPPLPLLPSWECDCTIGGSFSSEVMQVSDCSSDDPPPYDGLLEEV